MQAVLILDKRQVIITVMKFTKGSGFNLPFTQGGNSRHLSGSQRLPSHRRLRVCEICGSKGDIDSKFTQHASRQRMPSWDPQPAFTCTREEMDAQLLQEH